MAEAGKLDKCGSGGSKYLLRFCFSMFPSRYGVIRNVLYALVCIRVNKTISVLQDSIFGDSISGDSVFRESIF